jgi:hypothetical protein
MIKQSGAYINILSKKTPWFQIKCYMLFIPISTQVNYICMNFDIAIFAYRLSSTQNQMKEIDLKNLVTVGPCYI